MVTKLFYRPARLVRLPFDIRNRRLIALGENLTTGFGCRLEAHAIKNTTPHCIIMGKNIEMNDYVHIAAGQSITIGDDVLIASKVFITDLNHGRYTGVDPDSPLSKPNSREISCNPVVIGDRVWIGEFVSVLPGVNIGAGTIVGANSVVTRSLPPNVIAVGSPAVPIKQYNFSSQQWDRIN